MSDSTDNKSKDSKDTGILNFPNANYHASTLEEAQAALFHVAETTLSDRQLEEAGLIKTSAYVRTKRSKNALRSEKAKAKKAAAGIKQLNINVPEEHKHLLKTYAKALCDAKDLGSDIPTPSVFAAKNDAIGDDNMMNSHIEKCRKVLSKGGIRAVFLKLLLI